MNFLRQGFRKLSSDRLIDRQTDTTKVIYDAASRVVSNNDDDADNGDDGDGVKIHSQRCDMILSLTDKLATSDKQPT